MPSATSTLNGNKDEAKNFLQTFERELNAALPRDRAIEAEIRSIITDAKTDTSKRHLRLPEAVLLNHYVLPVLYKELQVQVRLSADDAKRALLNEYHRSTPDISQRSPIRAMRHPFRKVLGASPASVYKEWRSGAKGALTQSCPDFALQAPFPHSIVFEGKYYSSGSLAYAEKQLATNLYQAFFYRGLPRLDATKKHPEWNYDYACLLAFDASRDGTLKQAWRNLGQTMQESFWSGANIYVLIV